LRLVLLGGEIKSATEKFEVVARAVPADFVHQLDKAQVYGTPCGWRNGRFRGWFHSVCPLNLGAILIESLGFGGRFVAQFRTSTVAAGCKCSGRENVVL